SRRTGPRPRPRAGAPARDRSPPGSHSGSSFPASVTGKWRGSHGPALGFRLLDSRAELRGLLLVERLETAQPSARIVEPAHLHVRLAKILERLRVVRPELEGPLVRLDRLWVLSLLAE